jgi:CBS domain-containing protein
MLMSRLRIADVMTTDVVSVDEDAPFREIVDLLAERGVSAVPVLDAAGHVVGVVSQADLLHRVELTAHPCDGYLFEGARRRAGREKAMAATARDLMSQPALTVTAYVSVSEGARRMDEAEVKRLPVVDEQGRLVGIVSRGDLLKVFRQPDAAIAERVVADVLRRAVGVAPPEVTVSVQDGVVTLAGTVERRSQIPVALGLTAAVDGVVDVVSELAYRWDDTVVGEVPGPGSQTRRG